MKNIKILMLFILTTGFVAGYSQQASLVSQDSPAIEVTGSQSQPELSAGQVPAAIPGSEMIQVMTGTQSSSLDKQAANSTNEPNVAMVPVEYRDVTLTGATQQTREADGKVAEPSVADVPGATQPERK